MKLFNKKKTGHVGGAWFTASDGEVFFVFDGGGGSGGLLVILMLLAELVLRLIRWILRSKPSPDSLESYQGFVYCQIYDNDLRFFKTYRGTSRTILKPAAIIRPLDTLISFRTITTTPPKVALTFSDGVKIELFVTEDEAELAKFRDMVNSKQTQAHK